MLHVCPTDFIHASAEGVWRLIVTPADLARWSETTVIDAPFLLQSGDRVVLGAGLGQRLKIALHVQRADQPHEIVFRVRLPFGVVNDEVIQVASYGADACRVTFN
jgi:uncharacterized protein YndB with AHSA1/START domain